MNKTSLKNAVISAVSAHLAALLVIFLASVFAVKTTSDPLKIIRPLSYFAVAAGGFFSGAFAVKLSGERTVSTPIISSVLYLVLLIAISLIAGDNKSAGGTMSFFISCALAIAGAVAAAFIFMPGGRKSTVKAHKKAKKRYSRR